MDSHNPYQNISNCDPSQCISNKVKQLDRITSNIFRKYLRPFDLTDSQLTILFILAKSEGKTQKELSMITSLEKSSIHRNLQRLIASGYLSKSGFPIIQITETGKQLLESVIPEWNKAMKEIRTILEEDGENALQIVFLKLRDK